MSNTHQPTVHNPTNFAPDTYTVLDYLDNQRPKFCGETQDEFLQTVKSWEADMERALGYDWRSKTHRCIHCGNGRVRWITAVLHIPSNTRVVFGAECTKRLDFQNQSAFKLAQLQARADARKVRFMIYNKRQEFLTANPKIADALVAINNPVHAKNAFVKDVLSKLDTYGELSVRQVECVIASMDKDVQRAAVEATEVKGDAPSGRVVVTGTVLTVKGQDSPFGFVTKMLLKLENNSKAWMTVPASSGVGRNDTITVRATFTPSKDDKSFAFGSRPTIINIVAPVAGGAQ